MRRHFGIKFVLCQFLFSGFLGAAVTLSVSPSSISLSGLASSNSPITSYSARVSATGTGSGALVVSTTPAFSWLSAWAGSSTIAAGGAAVVIAVSADPGSGDLNTGTNSGSVTITSGTSSVTINPPSASWVSVNTGGITKVTGGKDPGSCTTASPQCVTVNVTVTPTGKQLVSDGPLTATVTISGSSGPPVTIIVVLKSQGADIFASLPAPFSALLAGQQSDANNIVEIGRAHV